jgi:hypothetical protein
VAAAKVTAASQRDRDARHESIVEHGSAPLFRNQQARGRRRTRPQAQLLSARAWSACELGRASGCCWADRPARRRFDTVTDGDDACVWWGAPAPVVRAFGWCHRCAAGRRTQRADGEAVAGVEYARRETFVCAPAAMRNTEPPRPIRSWCSVVSSEQGARRWHQATTVSRTERATSVTIDGGIPA